ncbi:hypothetical protein BH23ACI1_BH23ACI1_19000 [soil metagenome]
MPAKNQCFYGSGTPLSRQYRNADHDCEIPVLVRALLHRITLASVLWAACAAAAEGSQAGSATTGAIGGRVIEARTGAALSRVLVTIEGSGPAELTDDEGRFELTGVEAGLRRLLISVVGYTFVRREVNVAPGERLELTIPLSEGTGTYAESVTVSTDRFHAPDPGVASQQVLGSADIQNLRGVAADDPLRAVQVLPGVATGDDLRSEFSVRGSGFGQMNLTVDGFASPYLLHTVRAVEDFSQSGSVAMINSDILENVTLLNGGYAQRFGDRTGGEVNFRLREGSRDRHQVRAAVSGTSASAVLEGPIGASRRGSWLVSGRHSYLHLIVERLMEEEGLHFKFADAQAKFVYDLTSSQRAELAILTGRSRFRSSQPGGNADDVFDGTNATAMAVSTWRMVWPSAMLTGKGMSAWNGFANDDAIGRVRLDEGADTQLAGRVDVTAALGPFAVEAGIQVERTDQRRTRIRYIQPRHQTVNDYEARGSRAGAYSLVRWAAGRLTIAPGVRADRWSVTGESTASPWVQSELRVGRGATLRGGAGVYRQFPAFEHTVGLLGRPDARASRADQFDLGVEQRIGEALRAQVTTYLRTEEGFLRRAGAETRLDGTRIVVGDQRAAFEQRLDGQSRGIELLVQRRHPNGLSGWISYGYGRHRRHDTVTGERYWSDLDQRHTLNIYAFYRVSDRTSLSAKLRAGSNTPAPGYFRQVDEGYFLSEQRNEYRLPAYSRLDVRANRTFSWGAHRLTLFGEVMNVLNRENVRFAPPNLTREPVRVFRLFEPLIPVVPSVGVLIEW